MEIIQQVGSDLFNRFLQNPNLLIALVVFIFFLWLSRRVKRTVENWLDLGEGSEKAGQGLVRVLSVGTVLIGLLIAAVIAVPRFDPILAAWESLMTLDIAVDFTLALQKVVDMVNSLIVLLPNIIIGLMIFSFFRLASGWVQAAVRKVLKTSGRSDHAALIFGRLASYITSIGGVLVALVVVLPGFDPATLISGLGIGGVAIGFAFRDILQNFLAGLLLLMTDPFRIGDQIVVKGFEGTVEDIQTRATILKTYDGRRVVIPNGDLFTESVIVNTAYDKRRSQYDVGIGYEDNIELATSLILNTIPHIEGVLPEPAPDVQVVDLADSSINLRVRWWTDPQRSNVIQVRNKVLTTINSTLTSNGVNIPYPTQTVLFYNQTATS